MDNREKVKAAVEASKAEVRAALAALTLEAQAELMSIVERQNGEGNSADLAERLVVVMSRSAELRAFARAMGRAFLAMGDEPSQ